MLNRRTAVRAMGVLAAVAVSAIVIAGKQAPKESANELSGSRAAQAAVKATLGGGITSVDHEDGNWEVEVTKLDGRRVDVLLDGEFRVIRIEDDANRIAAPDRIRGHDDREKNGPAARAALRAMGGGTVEDVDRGSENVATWEVEVTRPDGRRTDVLLDARFNLIGIRDKQEPAAALGYPRRDFI